MPDKQLITESTAAGELKIALRKRMLLAVALLACVGGALVFPFPLQGRLWGDIFDLAHAPVFCLSLICLVGFFDPAAVGAPLRFATILPMTRHRVLLVTLVLMAVGLVGEFLQQFANRNPSWTDVLANSAGLLAGCVWIYSINMHGYRRILLASAAVGILILVNTNPALEAWDGIQQVQNFPVLASFERPREIGNWHPQAASISRTTEWSSDGDTSLSITMQPSEYPGVAMLWLEPDWTNFGTLHFDIRNPNEKPLRLIVKIQDTQHTETGFRHNDRFHQSVTVAPHRVTAVTVDLAEVLNAPAERQMNMQQINMIELFSPNLLESTVFLLDHVWLEK